MSAPTLTSKGEQLTLDSIKRLVLSTNRVRWDHPDLDDIVQEVAIKIWKNPGTNASIVANSAIVDYLRKHGPITKHGKERITGNTLSLDANVATAEDTALIDTVASTDVPIEDMNWDSDGSKRLLAMLSPHEHYAVLAVASGVPQNKIARELWITEARVSQHLDSARRRWSGEKPPYTRKPLRERPQCVWEKSDSPERKRREIQVLQWLADGVPVGSMPGRLGIGRNHLNRITAGALRRMGAHTKPQAVAEAMRRGLIK